MLFLRYFKIQAMNYPLFHMVYQEIFNQILTDFQRNFGRH